MYTTVPMKAAPDLDRPVVQIMHPDPVRIDADRSLADAARAMLERRVHALLVCDAGGEPLGWVTTRGMLHNSARDWSRATCRQAVTETLADVAAHARAGEALDALLASGASHVLVRGEHGAVLGVVAESDLLRLLAAAEER
jgi:CBS domain-containing protein